MTSLLHSRLESSRRAAHNSKTWLRSFNSHPRATVGRLLVLPRLRGQWLSSQRLAAGIPISHGQALWYSSLSRLAGSAIGNRGISPALVQLNAGSTRRTRAGYCAASNHASKHWLAVEDAFDAEPASDLLPLSVFSNGQWCKRKTCRKSSGRRLSCGDKTQLSLADRSNRED